MSKRCLLNKVSLVFLVLCFSVSVVFAVLFATQEARAADEDTVTVSGVKVEWDGNGGGNDLVTLTLTGASFVSNTDSNAHWDYFAPFVYVNGTSVTGQVAWAIEGRYTATADFCFYLNQNVLKQDGTDIIEIREGCKIPRNNGEDYYVVSETASFVSPVETKGTGTETFVAGSAVTVGGVSVEWDGNGGNHDLVTLSLDGAAFSTANLVSNSHRQEIKPYIFVNGTQIENVAWAIERRYDNPKHYCFYLEQDVLKQDGTDVIEIRKGCHIPENDGESYYVVAETVTYASSGTSVSGSSETFVKQFIWAADTKYDANGDIFEKQEAQTGVLGGYDSLVVSSSDIGSKYPAWGITGYATNTAGDLASEQFAVFEFVNPIDASAFKSVTIEYKYDAQALFYVYPLDVETLGYETAVQSFRTVGSGINSVQLSAVALKSAEGGNTFNGFILQLVDGTSKQLFIDSITLSTSAITTEPVEKVEEEQPFVWELNKEYDADSAVFAVTDAQTDALGGYDSLAVTIGNMPQEHPDWNLPLTAYSAQTNGELKVEQFAVFEFVNPIALADVGAKSVKITFVYNSSALFYIYPKNAASLGYGNAVQSFRTTSGSQTLTISAEDLAADGVCGGFIIQLVDGSSAQFFLDSITLSSASYDAGDVEQVVEFAWELGKEYDINDTILKKTEDGKIGGYAQKGITFGSGHADWGLTGDGFANTQNLAKNDCIVIEFAVPVELEDVKSFTIDVLHNASTGFYVYPFGTTDLGYDSAVQSFRTSSGLMSIELSAEKLLQDGVCRGFIIQAMTDSGVQFFLDNITLSDKTVEAEKEDFTEPEYEVSEVSIVGVSYTYCYEGGYDDLLLITFDRAIFDNSSAATQNERVGVDDFAKNLLINGVSIADSGIGDYALRNLWTNPVQLGIFIKNGQSGSMNNDAFDEVTFKAGFAIRGSTGDYTMYTTTEDAVFYTNRALDKGTQVTLSKTSDPQVDQTLVPLSVDWSVAGGNATLAITFNQTVQTEGTDFTDNILQFVSVNDKLLSEWGSAVTVGFDGMTIKFTFAADIGTDDDLTITVKKGLNVQTNPEQELTLKTVEEDAAFVRYSVGDNYFFAQDEQLSVYWLTSPSAEDEDGYITFELRLSAQSGALSDFNFPVSEYIRIGEKSLSDILAENKDAGISLSDYTLTVKIPASYLKDGLVVTVLEGFAIPAGILREDVTFTYDADFEEFTGEVHREAIEDQLTPTNVNTIITATDGVARGTNQLFIEFTTPCSMKYLPFAQADTDTVFSSYGSVGVTMSARYAYELTAYGIRESLLDYLLLDDKTLREWAIEAGGGAESVRYIDIYYLGETFGVYYLQIVINRESDAVMDWNESHTITFKQGFITPMLGVFEKDVQWAWNPETQSWAPDESANATVDPDAQLKAEEGELFPEPSGGCSGVAAATGTVIGAALLASAVALLIVCRRRAADTGVHPDKFKNKGGKNHE